LGRFDARFVSSQALELSGYEALVNLAVDSLKYDLRCRGMTAVQEITDYLQWCVDIYTPLLESENAADVLGGAAAATEPPNPFLTALLEIDEADLGSDLEGHLNGVTVTIADSDEQEAELRVIESSETSELQTSVEGANDRPPRRRPNVGMLLGERYRISQFMGNGAHAMVFIAVDVETRKRYAAKVFERTDPKGGLVDGDHDKLCLLSASQEAMAVWLETTKGLKDSSSTEGDRTKNGSRGLNSSSYEAANMARHSHPHLIRLSHFFYEVQWPVILMEVCELGSLEDLVAAYRVKGEDVPESLVAMVLVHLSQALYELHSGNVLHRDVKLANVFVSYLLDFKLGDLGVAKHLASVQNETQTFAGTPVYMAPEVIANLPYSVQSDIFSLGLLLFELCTQQRMFHPTSWTNLTQDHLDPYPRVEDHRYSPQLCDLIASMVEPTPEDRPTAAQLLRSPYVQAALRTALHTRLHMLNELNARG